MIFKLAWRNIWRNKRRSVITLISVLIAVFLSILTRSMQLGTYEHMIDNVVGSYTGYVQIHSKGYWNERSIDNAFLANDSLMHNVSNVKGVETVLPRLENYGLLSSGDLTKVVGINGIDLKKELEIQDINSKIIEGTLFKNQNDIVIGKGVASYFNVGVNDTLVFLGQGYHGMLASGKFNISGIIDLKSPVLNKSTVLQSLQGAQYLFSAPELVTSLVIDKKENTGLHELQKAIEGVVDNNTFEVMNWEQMIPELHQAILADSVGGMLMVAILYMILTFGIFGTVLMMTQERKFEFGVLVSIGMKKAKLIFMVFIETVFLSLIGVLSGVILAYPIMLWKHYDPLVLPGTEGKMMENFGFSPEMPFYIQPDLAVTHALLIFAIAVIITIYPILVIKKLNPLEAMRG
ncbi:MAG TPA: FtsX-like permease family protein [Flavobacteriaceae bacterium]|nr:FtsX-like permease family protein [Flavobacteriaceae bacterium]